MLQLKIVEVGDGIRFGPESDHSGVERLVTEIEDLLVVIADIHATVLVGDSQRVPLPHVDRLVEVL
jgi:hypothetical protein